MTSQQDDNYFSVSEDIFQNWMAGAHDPMLHEHFDLDFVPEPYLLFGTPSNACVFLTTNPGGGMAHQRHPELSSDSIVEAVSYHATAQAMGQFYLKHLKGPARSNIEKMMQLASALGYTGVIQVEMIPWHSSNLPNKQRMMKRLERAAAYQRYINALRGFVEQQPLVLSWAAGSKPSSRTGEGVAFKAEMLGIDLATSKLVELGRKKEISQCLMLDRQGENVRGLFVTQGSASLPANVASSDGHPKHDVIVRAIRELAREPLPAS